jgi:hypothetical protein
MTKLIVIIVVVVIVIVIIISSSSSSTSTSSVGPFGPFRLQTYSCSRQRFFGLPTVLFPFGL